MGTMEELCLNLIGEMDLCSAGRRGRRGCYGGADLLLWGAWLTAGPGPHLWTHYNLHTEARLHRVLSADD